MDTQHRPPSSAEPDPTSNSRQSALDTSLDASNDARKQAPVNSPSQPLLAGQNNSLRPTLRSLFVGPDGILAFPRWVLYLVAAWIIFQLESWLLLSAQLHFGDLRWRLLVEASMMVAAILPACAMTLIERRPFGDFGLPPRRAFGRNFWIGAIWGIAAISLLMFALHVAGAFALGSLALHGPRIWKFAAYYFILFLLTALFEEFLLRGYSQWVLARGINFWPAATFLSVGFGYIHSGNPGEARVGLVAAGLIGFFLCLTLRRTGDLWWAVGFHMAWDWGETFLYSVPNSGSLLPRHLLNSNLHGATWLSGGSVGPEGSFFVLIVIAVLWIVFDRIYRPRGADTALRFLPVNSDDSSIPSPKSHRNF
jgi:membrane protease YdiL (CAAX protease family)